MILSSDRRVYRIQRPHFQAPEGLRREQIVFHHSGCVGEFNCLFKKYQVRRWSPQRHLLAVTSPRGIQYWKTAIRGYIFFILSQLLHLKKQKEIRKFQNSSYIALEYLPHKHRMNYSTNRTLHLQFIHCPLRGR